MEYLERGSLRRCIGLLTLAQIGGVLEGLLAGLAHAERRGIVHRDMKPENVLVTLEGHVKIADFGIAKATTRGADGPFTTATGHDASARPRYMAPEQAMAKTSVRGPTCTRSAAWLTSCSPATSRSTTPRRRWRCCFGTSTNGAVRACRSTRTPTPPSATGSSGC